MTLQTENLSAETSDFLEQAFFSSVQFRVDTKLLLLKDANGMKNYADHDHNQGPRL